MAKEFTPRMMDDMLESLNRQKIARNALNHYVNKYLRSFNNHVFHNHQAATDIKPEDIYWTDDLLTVIGFLVMEKIGVPE